MKAKAKIAHDKKTNELLGSSIQRDLITNLSSTELQQWIDEHQTNLLEISKRRGHIKEALDILDAKIAKKNANTRKNKKKNERKKAKKSKRASPPEPTLASPPEPTPASPPEPTPTISPTPLQSVPQQQTIPSQPPTMFFNTNPQINPFIFTDITAPTVMVPISNIVLESAPSGFLESVTNEQLYDSFEKISKPVQGESLDPLYLIQRQSRDRVLIAFKHHLLAQHLLTKCREGCSITLNDRKIKFRVMPWSQTVEHQTYINSATQLAHRGGRTRKHIKTKRKTRRTKCRTKRKTKRKRKKRKRRTRKKRGRGIGLSRPAKVAAIGALTLGSGVATVSPTAKQTYQEIMRAPCNAPFRQMVLPHHPDKGGNIDDFSFVESARQSRKKSCGRTRRATPTEETPKKEKPPPGKSGKRWRREQNEQRRQAKEEARKQSERQEEADRKTGQQKPSDKTDYGDMARKIGATAAVLGGLEYVRRRPGYGPNNPRPQRSLTPPRR